MNPTLNTLEDNTKLPRFQISFMAIQAQYPSNIFSVCNGGLEEIQMNQQNWESFYQTPAAVINMASFPALYNGGVENQFINAGTVFSDPESDLTCNLPLPSKRSRVDHSAFAAAKTTVSPSPSPAVVPVDCRAVNSAATSTSGRALAHDLAGFLHQQSAEIDALLRLNMEKMRAVLQEAMRRQWQIAASAVAKRLREKDAELDAAVRRNLELEERVRVLAAENQVWYTAASNNEAVVARLRTSLDQLLHQTAAEGYGDSSDVVPGNAGDAESSCNAGDEEDDVRRHQRTCQVCRKSEVSVLLLPCRHLCLCKGCEPKTASCPACETAKDDSLHIFLT